MSVPVLPGYKEPSDVTAVTLDSMEPSWQGGRDPRRIQFRLTMPVNPMLTMSLEHGADGNNEKICKGGGRLDADRH